MAKLQHELLGRLRDADQIDWSRAAVDVSMAPAKKGRPAHVRIPALIAIGRAAEEGFPHHRHALERLA